MRRTSPLLAASLSGLFLQLILVGATGIALAYRFRAGAEIAYQSVDEMQRNFLWAFLRAAHYWGAAIFLVHSVIHLIGVVWMGAYRTREAHWWAAIGFAALGLAMTISGALAPLDLHAASNAVNELDVVRQTPMVGGSLANFAAKGASFSAATEPWWMYFHTRALAAAMVVVALLALPAWGRSRKRGGFFVVLGPLATIVVALILPAPLGQPGLQGSVAAATYDQVSSVLPATAPRPDWYALPAYSLGRYFEGVSPGNGWVGAILIPTVAFTLLVLLPLLWRKAPVWLIRTALVLSLAGVGWVTYRHAGDCASLVGDRDAGVSLPITHHSP